MKVFPSTIRGQIIMAFTACFLGMALIIGINYRMIYLVVLVLLLSFVIFLVWGKIVRPLGRITRESENIAQGVFQGPMATFGDPNNEIYGLIAAFNRIMNELQHRQELLVQSHKNTAIGTLTSGIAHEINNPLNNIVLTLETLIEDNQTMEPQERLQLYQEALDQTDRAGDIVRNLLEFSRANHPQVEKVNIEELISNIIQLLHNEFKIHRIKIFNEIRGAFPALYLDKSGLQQVLVNLLLNSVQAMPDGGQLRISLNRVQNELQINIADTGVGIPSENLGLIFNPFFTTKKGRAGLGLSICRDILQKQGGRIEVQSREGLGSTFSPMIPLSEVQPDK
jgi:two-component system NtrC family sensor kinase